MVVVVALFVAAFALLALASRGYREIEAMQSLDKAEAAVRAKFPGAKPASTRELAEWLRGPSGVVILVDAREAEEFTMSRLPGAHRAGDIGKTPGLAALAETKAVVVYDSVGFRSAKYAERLRNRGVPGAMYLEGGIFRWANEGRPLVDAEGRPTDRVHPHRGLWGKLLKTSSGETEGKNL